MKKSIAMLGVAAAMALAAPFAIAATTTNADIQVTKGIEGITLKATKAPLVVEKTYILQKRDALAKLEAAEQAIVPSPAVGAEKTTAAAKPEIDKVHGDMNLVGIGKGGVVDTSILLVSLRDKSIGGLSYDVAKADAGAADVIRDYFASANRPNGDGISDRTRPASKKTALARAASPLNDVDRLNPAGLA